MNRFFTVLFRLFIALLAFWGTMDAWLLRVPHDWIYFTTQTNIFLGVIMVWAALVTLFGKKSAPSVIKGAATLYIAITGLVANFVLDLSTYGKPPVFLGINQMDMVHIIVPVLAVLDFIFFDTHRTMNIRYALRWLIYPLLYFVFILIINFFMPSVGYPYPFIDLNTLTAGLLLRNIGLFTLAFYLLGLLIVALDSIFPKK